MDAELSADQTTELHVQMDKAQDSDLVTPKPTETPESNEIAESLVEEVNSAEKEEITIVGEEPKKHLDAPKPSPVHDESISDAKQGGITETDAVENSTTHDMLVKEEKTEVVEASPIGEITGEIENVESKTKDETEEFKFIVPDVAAVEATDAISVVETIQEAKNEQKTEQVFYDATPVEGADVAIIKEESVDEILAEEEKTKFAETEEPKNKKNEEVEIMKEENKSGFSEVTPVTVTPEEKQIELPKEETVNSVTETVEQITNPESKKEVELVKEEKPEVAVTESVPVAATTEEPKDEKTEEVEVIKEENKSGLPDTTPVVATEVTPVSATAEEEKEIELPKEETVNSVIETVEGEKTEIAVIESVPVVETTEEPKHDKTEEAEIVKEENKSGFPDATPVAATDEKKEIELPKEETVSSVTETVEETPNPEFRQEEKETELGTVTEVLKETTGAVVASEIGEGLPEKKRRALGDHLEEEKAKDSVNPVTEESTRDLNMGDIAKTEVDEKKIEKGTATEVTCKDKEENEKPVARELVEPVKEVTAKGNSRNILSKVKHQIVKVKKAIIGKSPSSKNMPLENRDEVKVK